MIMLLVKGKFSLVKGSFFCHSKVFIYEIPIGKDCFMSVKVFLSAVKEYLFIKSLTVKNISVSKIIVMSS